MKDLFLTYLTHHLLMSQQYLQLNKDRTEQVLCHPTLGLVPCLSEWRPLRLVGQTRNLGVIFDTFLWLITIAAPSPQLASFTSEISLESVQFSPSP